MAKDERKIDDILFKSTRQIYEVLTASNDQRRRLYEDIFQQNERHLIPYVVNGANQLSCPVR
jgi:hypothetical protein